MNRYASVELRRLVDDAVGPRYDGVFLRLDVLRTSPEGRCSCSACRVLVAQRCDALVASLPAL